jgi:hypothetical protein
MAVSVKEDKRFQKRRAVILGRLPRQRLKKR